MAEPCVTRQRWWLLALPALFALSGCDMLGLETPGMAAQRQAQEAHAVGAACRHAVRSIEDCFAANPRMSRAAIFEGWREMDQHMRDNEIPGMPQQPVPAVANPVEQVLPVPAAPRPASAPSPAATPPRPAPGTAPAAAPAPPGAPPPRPASAPGGATPGIIQLPPRPGPTAPQPAAPTAPATPAAPAAPPAR